MDNSSKISVDTGNESIISSTQKNTENNFAADINATDDLVKIIASKKADLLLNGEPKQNKWTKIVLWSLIFFVLVLFVGTVFYYAPVHLIVENSKDLLTQIDTNTFLLMLLTGFIAQMVDGSMGMGYGTISTTFLLAMGVPPAVVSSRVHSARVFSSGVGGYSHHRFGNINKKLFKALVIPGVIGAFIGAALAVYGNAYSQYIRIPLSFYTCYLGYYIIKKAFKKHQSNEKVKQVGWLASVGGFMDAFAGGGWGALVTSTLISKRKNPRYVIGSVCLAEFFVVLSSAITFFILLKHLPILEIAGLIIGGVIAAPIAARFVGKLPVKKVYIAVGLLVIGTSLFTLGKVLIKIL